MRTLQSMLQKLNTLIDFTDDELENFELEFNDSYDSFITDFIFSLKNDEYAAYTGMFISKVRLYFEPLFEKYNRDKILLSATFIYTFFIEMEGKYNTHGYRGLSPYTLKELLSEKRIHLDLTEVPFQYKNSKDKGNSALFMILAVISTDFNIKYKEIDAIMSKHQRINFTFRGSLSDNSVMSAVNKIITETVKKLISLELLALIPLIQIYTFDKVEYALSSVYVNKMQSSNIYKLNFRFGEGNENGKINVLFPCEIDKYVSIFNLMVSNVSTLINETVSNNTTTDTLRHLSELMFLETINRMNEVLSQPKDNINGLFNCFYKHSINSYMNSSDERFLPIDSSTLNIFFTHNITQSLAHPRSSSVSELVPAKLTKYGLTNIVEANLPIRVIDVCNDEFNFNSSIFHEKIEDALNELVYNYTNYITPESEVLKEFSEVMFNYEVSIIEKRLLSVLPDRKDLQAADEVKVLVSKLKKDNEILNIITYPPYFILEGLAKNKEFDMQEATNVFFSIIYKLSNSTTNSKEIIKKEDAFFIDTDNFSQLEYINAVMNIEIESASKLLEYPEYFPITTKFIRYRYALPFRASALVTPRLFATLYKTIVSSLIHSMYVEGKLSNLLIFSFVSFDFEKTNIGDLALLHFLLNEFTPEILEESVELRQALNNAYKLFNLGIHVNGIFGMEDRNNANQPEITISNSTIRYIDAFTSRWENISHKFTSFITNANPNSTMYQGTFSKLSNDDKELINSLVNSIKTKFQFETPPDNSYINGRDLKYTKGYYTFCIQKVFGEFVDDLYITEIIDKIEYNLIKLAETSGKVQNMDTRFYTTEKKIAEIYNQLLKRDIENEKLNIALIRQLNFVIYAHGLKIAHKVI